MTGADAPRRKEKCRKEKGDNDFTDVIVYGMSTFYFLSFYSLAGAISARAAPVLVFQVHDLGSDGTGADAQPSDTGCEVEATRPGSPGVDDEATLGLGDERTVGMSVDQHSLWISLE